MEEHILRIVRKPKHIIVGIIAGLIFFVVSGMITALIPNPLFLRMTEVKFFDYVLLGMTSTLVFIFFTLNDYQKSTKSFGTFTGGGFVGFLGFSCAICNKILVMLLGVAGVLTFITPYQPIIGIIGAVLMAIAVYSKIKEIKSTTGGKK